jgi:site-specific DNA recombinase
LGEVVHKGLSYPGEHERIIDEQLWIAVQAQLLVNRGHRRRSRLESGSLLTGLTFDARGNLMSPTYSVRRGKRYRYYVSRGFVRSGRKEDGGSHARVGAEDLEGLVVKALAEQLSRPELLSEPTSGSWNAATRTLVREHIERVVLDRREVRVIRRVAGGATRSGEVGEPDDTMNVYRAQLPAPQPRAHKEIVIPGEPGPRRVNHGLILAIARAKRWMQGLCDGTCNDTNEIARHFKLNDAHVRRLLRFGYLAPDIVEAIVEGRQPRALTVRRLLHGMPCAWADQRRAFGFTR